MFFESVPTLWSVAAFLGVGSTMDVFEIFYREHWGLVYAVALARVADVATRLWHQTL